MPAALVVACIAGGVALASAALSGWTQLRVTQLESKLRKEEREAQAKSEAKVVLDRCRGPLLDAAWQLGDRLENIRHSERFRAYLTKGDSRELDARLTTLFRFAHYLGWREFVRTKVQLLQFEKKDDTKTAAWLLNDVTWVLASDELDHQQASPWGDEQRGIGELMIESPSGASLIVRGHATFRRDYAEVFACWMDRFADDLFSDAAAEGDRLRLVQWALYGLVRQLDEEGVYRKGWINRTAAEIEATPQEDRTRYENDIREHIAATT